MHACMHESLSINIYFVMIFAGDIFIFFSANVEWHFLSFQRKTYKVSDFVKQERAFSVFVNWVVVTSFRNKFISWCKFSRQFGVRKKLDDFKDLNCCANLKADNTDVSGRTLDVSCQESKNWIIPSFPSLFHSTVYPLECRG